MADSETTSPLPSNETRRTSAARRMLEPLSHRGFWLKPEEKNTEAAFRRALEAGFGIETDVRDRNGVAVIAHDVADPGAMTLSGFLELYSEYPARPMLALNIKADGLQALVKEELERRNVDTYFVFDMSIPDLLDYRTQGIRYYARVSEYELAAIGIEQADGVWLDQFEGDWVDEAAVERFTDMGKDVCIVSPELHRRDPRTAWKNYHRLTVQPARGTIYLCTDFPSRAREFFA
jgi:glycerophosphoryl diester phosphodiesterase